MKVLEAQMSADAAKNKMWSYDKQTDGEALRFLQMKIATTQKHLRYVK